MLVLTKAIATLLLPPGLFLIILGLIIFLVFLKNKKVKKLIQWNLILLFFLIYFLSLPVVSSSLIYSLERDFLPPKNAPSLNKESFQKAQLILVLGGGVANFSPEESGQRASLSSTSFKRVFGGWKLAEATGLPILFSGGIVFPEPGYEAEADVMQRTIKLWNFDDKKIYTETKSRNTEANARLSKEILTTLNISNVVLVTSAWHLKRASIIFKKQALAFTPYASDFLSSYPNEAFHYPSLLDCLPSMGSLSGSELVLHEYLGILFLKLKN